MIYKVTMCCVVPLGLMSFCFLSIGDEEAQVGVSSKVECFYSLEKADEPNVYLACSFLKLELKLCYL